MNHGLECVHCPISNQYFPIGVHRYQIKLFTYAHRRIQSFTMTLEEVLIMISLFQDLQTKFPEADPDGIDLLSVGSNDIISWL